MGLLNIVETVISPVTNLIDSLHTSDEEKRVLTNELKQIENVFAAEVLKYEAKLMDAQASIIKAEAQGQSWLQRSWRPITMLTFLMIRSPETVMLPFTTRVRLTNSSIPIFVMVRLPLTVISVFSIDV